MHQSTQFNKTGGRRTTRHSLWHHQQRPFCRSSKTKGINIA